MTLEEAFKELEDINSRWIIKYFELQKENECLKDRLTHEVEMIEGAAKEETDRLKKQNEQMKNLLKSANIFISNSCDMECFELFDEQKSCRHDDWIGRYIDCLAKLGER